VKSSTSLDREQFLLQHLDRRADPSVWLTIWCLDLDPT
jgi:hypothetical protein